MATVDYVAAATNYFDLLKERNLNQFLNSTELNKILQIIAEVYQESEQDLVDIAEAYILETATGEQLDVLGEEVNLFRVGSEDESFRAYILLRSASRLYSTNKEDILQLLRLLTGDTEPEVYTGLDKLVEVQLQDVCLDDERIKADITNLFPPVTQLLVIKKSGLPFGFEGSVGTGGFGGLTPDGDGIGVWAGVL